MAFIEIPLVYLTNNSLNGGVHYFQYNLWWGSHIVPLHSILIICEYLPEK